MTADRGSAEAETGDDVQGERLIVPAALVIAFAIIAGWRDYSLISLPLWVSTLVPHELGHALAGWMCGRVYIPTPIMAVTFYDHFTWWFALPAAAALIGGIWRSVRLRCYFLMMLLDVVLVTGAFLCVALTERQQTAVILFAGQAGEALLAVIFVLAFTVRMPRWMRWSRNRYFFLSIGSLSFANSVLIWFGAGRSTLRMGSVMDWANALSSDGKSTGDLDLLITDFGCSPQTLILQYQLVVAASALILLVGYLITSWTPIIPHALIRKGQDA